MDMYDLQLELYNIHKVNRTETDRIKSKPVLILGYRKPFWFTMKQNYC